MDKNEVMALMKAPMDDNLSFKTSQMPIGDPIEHKNLTNEVVTGWQYWQNFYYPQVIRESYPVYLKDRSEDKGKQAFEIIKKLKDKKLINVSKVADFIDLMDELIKIL